MSLIDKSFRYLHYAKLKVDVLIFLLDVKQLHTVKLTIGNVDETE